MSDVTEIESQLVYCADPECIDPATGEPSVAEPELDGEHSYYTCTVCGFDFGFDRVPGSLLGGSDSGTCAIGVPESIRRAAMTPPQSPEPTSTPVALPSRRN